jgi:hypothetical protein
VTDPKQWHFPKTPSNTLKPNFNQQKPMNRVLLHNNLSVLSKLVSEKIRLALGGVHLIIRPDGYQAHATDGRC